MQEGGPYTHCISIGHACPCAYALRASGLRDASYPFDWILADPAVVCHCVTTDFADFLDVGQYYHDGKERCTDIVRKASCHHKTYGARFFRHHCPHCFDVHHEYFKRSVERFRDVARSQDNMILFVWMAISDISKERSVSDSINKKVKGKLAETFIETINAPWKIIILDCYEGCETRQVHIASDTANCTWIKLYCGSKNIGVKFGDDLDNKMVSTVLSWFKSPNINTPPTSSQVLWPYALTKQTKKKTNRKWWCLCA